MVGHDLLTFFLGSVSKCIHFSCSPGLSFSAQGGGRTETDERGRRRRPVLGAQQHRFGRVRGRRDRPIAGRRPRPRRQHGRRGSHGHGRRPVPGTAPPQRPQRSKSHPRGKKQTTL